VRLWWDLSPAFVVAALALLVGGLKCVESYKDGIKVTIVSSKSGMDDGTQPAPRVNRWDWANR
jgi:hypothetical protein